MIQGAIFPELVTGRRDGFVARAWDVVEGSTRRGEASCDLTDRVLEVPLGTGEVDRVVRAHELMHSRVSPHVPLSRALMVDMTARSLACAEELRVNTLIDRLGFDVSLLRDGSEKIGGRRLAEHGDWGEAICFLMAVVGTGAEKEFLSGIRQGDPTWLGGLRAVRKRAVTLVASFGVDDLGATEFNSERIPRGYADVTMVLARVLTQSMQSRPPTDAESLRRFRRSLEPGGRRAPSGRFAALNFGDAGEMTHQARRGDVRRSRASVTGTTLRYPSRLLTDDARRGFASRARVRGGIIIIDQSGSMDLDAAALNAMLRRAPNALIIGYSHRPGDLGTTANVWIIAERGAIVEHCPVGNVGNGVDGPVLEWAIAHRNGSEPVVWVTDGQVTDSHDHPDDHLSQQCADMVRRHSIRLARDLDQGLRQLGAGAVSGTSAWSQFGRVGRKLMDSKGFSI